MKVDDKEVDKSALVIRLERNQKDLLQLKSKLNSYTCEPRTLSLFESMENLRNGLESMSAANSEILQALKEKKRMVDPYIDTVKEQLQKFNQLQQGVESYVQGARSC